MLVQPIQNRSYYTYQPKHSPKILNERSQNNTEYAKFPFGVNNYFTNQVAFTGGNQAAHRILDRSLAFGVKEYEALSHDDWAILKSVGGMFRQKDKRTKDFIIRFGEQFSERVHERYPNGFTFVSIGRSPAFLAKRLEFEGEDVRYCPISHLTCRHDIKFTPHLIQTYKKYLDTIGLTSEFAKTTDKPIVMVDYIHEGFSICNFERLLRSPEIGIKRGKNVEFVPIAINGQAGFFNFKGYIPNKPLFLDMMENEYPKEYTSIPYIDAREFKPRCEAEKRLNEFYQNGNQFKENIKTKMMNFLVIDNMLGRKNVTSL